MVEPHGCGGAATRPQAAPQPETNQDEAAWKRRQLCNPRNSATVFAHLLDNNTPNRALLNDNNRRPANQPVPIRH